MRQKYWHRRLHHGIGGAQDVQCDPGEVFDTTSMACVTAGQAITPLPDASQPVTIPTSFPTPTLPIPSFPGPSVQPMPQQAPQQAGMSLDDLKTPLIIGGVAIGLLAVVYMATK